MNPEKEAIRTLEELGYTVILIENDRVVYSRLQQEEKYCDGCQYLTFEQTPDPYDSFSIDFYAICTYLKRKVQGGLAFYETKELPKPLACPFLGRKLSKDEKKEMEEWMEERKMANWI